MPPPIGVVILAYGTSGRAVELAGALISDGVAPHAIVIVHNPALPGDSVPEPEDAGVEVLRMDRNRGYAAGMNAGIRHHLERGVEFVLSLTHEVRFRPGALATLLQAARAAPAYGALGPSLWWEGNRALSYGGHRRTRGGIEHILTRPDAPSGIARTDWVDGAAVLYRSAALERAGLLEERFFMYVEDAEICLRIARSGFEVGVVLGAEAEAAPGLDTRPGAWFYLSTRNGLEYARRAGGTRAVMWELARRVKESVNVLSVYLRPGAGPEGRERCRIELDARRRGVWHFIRRRWGPPPSALVGVGDISGTAPEE